MHMHRDVTLLATNVHLRKLDLHMHHLGIALGKALEQMMTIMKHDNVPNKATRGGGNVLFKVANPFSNS